MWEQLKYFLRFTAKDGWKTVLIERKERKIIVHFIYYWTNIFSSDPARGTMWFLL